MTGTVRKKLNFRNRLCITNEECWKFYGMSVCVDAVSLRESEFFAMVLRCLIKIDSAVWGVSALFQSEGILGQNWIIR